MITAIKALLRVVIIAVYGGALIMWLCSPLLWLPETEVNFMIGACAVVGYYTISYLAWRGYGKQIQNFTNNSHFLKWVFNRNPRF
jgi:hypothetical protein